MYLYCKEKFGVLVTLRQIAIPGATNGSNKATSNIEGAMSQGFCRYLVQTSPKLVIGNLRYKGNNHNSQIENKP